MSGGAGAKAYILMHSQVRIDAPARLHLGLIAMGTEGPRINGGLGFAIEQPSLSITVTANQDVEVVDKRRVALQISERTQLRTLIFDICEKLEFKHSPLITISGDAPSHHGLGAGTAIRLASVEATYILNGQFPTEEEVIAQSKRGGTSGVGVRTYFHGGLTFDLGHSGTGGHRPSRTWQFPGLPLQLARIDMPAWSVGICIPPNVPPLTQEQEQRVFSSATPVPQREVERTLYLALFGIFAAAAENDQSTFSRYVERLQSTAWKGAEWNAYVSGLLEHAALLRSAGARGVGLSSMGPALYFCADDLILNALPDVFHSSLLITTPRNRGRAVLVDALVAA